MTTSGAGQLPGWMLPFEHAGRCYDLRARFWLPEANLPGRVSRDHVPFARAGGAPTDEAVAHLLEAITSVAR